MTFTPPRYGYVQTRAKGHIDVLNAYAPSMRFGNLEMAISEPTVVNLFVATGDNSTFNLPVIGTSFQQELADLRSMVLAINQGETLRRSGHFEDLLNRALARTGTPRDIDNWARRLAENVVNLDD